MTKSITDIAREAGIDFDPAFGTCYTGNKQIERFAAAIKAAHLEELAGVEMPEPVYMGNDFVSDIFAFDQDQMREYAASAVAKEREKITQEMKEQGVYPKWSLDALCESAVAKERSECAAVCTAIALKPSNVILGVAISCADAIRARGNV